MDCEYLNYSVALVECTTLSNVPGEITAAVDINTIANEVYVHNYPEVKVLNNNIQKLSPKFVDELKVDVILMSPPCQPFTRVGNQKDIDDSRTDALKHICNLLPNCSGIQFILMENVKGFEVSKAREKYLDTLQRSGFFFREFILSPTDFGVPNTRHRYYCLARRFEFPFPGNVIYTSIPNNSRASYKKFAVKDILEPADSVDVNLFLDDKVLKKRAWLFDIVNAESVNTTCFTKAYTRYSEGTGSIFTPKSKGEVDGVFNAAQQLDSNSEEYVDILKTLQLRYFSPLEVARLMNFPDSFRFPHTTSLKQRYRLLGNSINILVVGELIKLLCS